MGMSDTNMDEVTDTLDTLYAMREEVSEEDHPAAREKMYARNRALEAAIEVIHERFDIPGEPFSVTPGRRKVNKVDAGRTPAIEED